MKKKEVLIIFVLAVLVTLGTGFWEMGQKGIYKYGIPADFLSIDWFFITNIDTLPFVLDILFWFLVLVVGRWVVRWIRRKRQ